MPSDAKKKRDQKKKQGGPTAAGKTKNNVAAAKKVGPGLNVGIGGSWVTCRYRWVLS